MAKSRTSMEKTKQIRLMIERGYSRRAVKSALRISQKTLKNALGETLHPGRGTTPSWASGLDWTKITDEIHRRGTTVKQLHQEYASDVSYLSFWRVVRERCVPEPEVSMRLVFKPGERTQIDFTDGILVHDRSTGQARKTQLFVGVLAFSSRVFGQFTWDQRLPSFIAAHESMWGYFGGVTPYVVLDNLKSGVSQADLYDPNTNPTYTEYANHMGFALLPARPYHPRDKAKGESNINVIQRQFYQEVRDRIFYSLDELNSALREYLTRLNSDIMKDHGVSRMDRFKEEVSLLRAIPQERFEMSEWRSAKVHPDCHIQVSKNFYSVPFRFVGQTVRLRVGSRVLEVFDADGNSIAAHAVLSGIGKTTTNQAHYPEHKSQIVSFSVASAKDDAQKIGPKTSELIEDLFSGSHPLKYLRRVQGILRLKLLVDSESLEYGAAQAMKFNKKRLSYIRDCAKHYQRNGTRLAVVGQPHRDLQHMNLQGTR